MRILWGGELGGAGRRRSCGDGGGDERHDSTLTVSLWSLWRLRVGRMLWGGVGGGGWEGREELR